MNSHLPALKCQPWMILQSPAWKPIPHDTFRDLINHLLFTYLQLTLKLKHSVEGLLHGMKSFFGLPPPSLLQTVHRIENALFFRGSSFLWRCPSCCQRQKAPVLLRCSWRQPRHRPGCSFLPTPGLPSASRLCCHSFCVLQQIRWHGPHFKPHLFCIKNWIGHILTWCVWGQITYKIKFCTWSHLQVSLSLHAHPYG